jgi:hypothetical protein
MWHRFGSARRRPIGGERVASSSSGTTVCKDPGADKILSLSPHQFLGNNRKSKSAKWWPEKKQQKKCYSNESAQCKGTETKKTQNEQKRRENKLRQENNFGFLTKTLSFCFNFFPNFKETDKKTVFFQFSFYLVLSSSLKLSK